MSSTLTKLARRFTLFLVKQADVLKDPFLKSTPGNERVEPELTEDIDDLVKDNLNLVILIERSFMEFQKETLKDNNRVGQQFASNVLLELEDIEAALTDPTLLNFDLNLESGLLDVIDQNASMIKSVLDMTRDAGSVAPEFKKLDQRVYKWINELVTNTDKIHDLAMSQSSFMEQTFADKPVRMVEKDERDVDEINPSEIHPDYDEPEFLSETALENSMNENNPEYEYDDDTGEYVRVNKMNPLRRMDGKADHQNFEF